MQDLLEQFDPLSNQNIQKNQNQLKNQNGKVNNKIRTSSSETPLFSSNSHTANLTIPSSTSNSLSQKRIIKPSSDSLSSKDQDPLGFLSNQNVQIQTESATYPSNKLNHKNSDLFTQAQIRSKLRQEALEKHLAHEPFKPTSPIQSPSVTPQTLKSPIINLQTCLNTTDTTRTPKIDSTDLPYSPSTSNQNIQSIKIPSELFQNRANKNKKPENNPKIMTRSEPRVTRPLDEHKLAAALLEGFDDFISAPPNPSSSSLQKSTINYDSQIQSFSTTLNSLSPINKNNNYLDSSRHSTPLSSFDGPEGVPNPIQFVGIHPKSQLVMDDELAEGIRLNLPNRLKISSEWKLIYSIDQDGSSLSTLYSKFNQTSDTVGESGSNHSTRAGFILVLKDHLGRRFGGFVNEPLRPSKEYYGSGECFLWKAVEFGPDDFRIGVAIKAYTWTGANDYMILSDHDLLSIGGGDGKFGLWIDSNLLKGSSTKCPAFNNEVLCSSFTSKPNANQNNENEKDEDVSFDVIGLECWMVST